MLVGLFLPQLPDAVAAEEQLRVPECQFLELGGPEPSPSEEGSVWLPTLFEPLVSVSNKATRNGHIRAADIRAHPALYEINPRAPPA